MALVSLTVRRERTLPLGTVKNYSSETWAIDDTNIKKAVPSVCNKDGVDDGLVNSKVSIEVGGQVVLLWCTETTAAIAALS